MLVVFANNDMLHNMSGAEILLMDGMFDVPKLMYQLYTIHAKVGETSTPVAFAMLPKKDTKIYSKLLEKIIDSCIERGLSPPNPDAVVVDFELAAVRSIEWHLPDSRVTGCLFHLNQNVQRWVTKTLGDELKQDTGFSMLMRCLVFLANLRPSDIP